MNYADVYLDYPVLATQHVQSSAAAAAGPIAGAVVADLGLVPLGTTTLVLSPAVRTSVASWDGRPDYGLRAFDFAADFGARWNPSRPDATVQGWWGIGSGLRAGWLQADYWDDVLAWGLGAWTGGGVVGGKGKIRPSFSVRADGMVSFGAYTGTLVTGEGTTTWTYWPSNARVSVLAGVEVR